MIESVLVEATRLKASLIPNGANLIAKIQEERYEKCIVHAARPRLIHGICLGVSPGVFSLACTPHIYNHMEDDVPATLKVELLRKFLKTYYV